MSCFLTLRLIIESHLSWPAASQCVSSAVHFPVIAFCFVVSLLFWNCVVRVAVTFVATALWYKTRNRLKTNSGHWPKRPALLLFISGANRHELENHTERPSVWQRRNESMLIHLTSAIQIHFYAMYHAWLLESPSFFVHNENIVWQPVTVIWYSSTRAVVSCSNWSIQTFSQEHGQIIVNVT